MAQGAFKAGLSGDRSSAFNGSLTHQLRMVHARDALCCRAFDCDLFHNSSITAVIKCADKVGFLRVFIGLDSGKLFAATSRLLHSRSVAAYLAVLMLSLATVPVGATVVWEDYRGRSGVPGVTTPTVDNYQNQGASATVRQNLRDIYASPTSTPTRTGSSPNIDFGLNTTLCNLTVNPASAACLAQAQGRVVHALVRFPAAGLYT